MEMPSGARNSAPVPNANASGSAPSSAASVVMMIGRNRSMQAAWIASSGVQAVLALLLQREIHQHDRVLLDDAHQQHDADDPHDRQFGAGHQQRQQRAQAGGGQGGDDGQRLQQAFVQHAQHDVDREERGPDQQRLRRQDCLQELARCRRTRCAPSSGIRSSAARRCTSCVASPSARPGRRLKLMVAAGNWPWWRTASGAVPRSDAHHGGSGTCGPVGAADVERSSSAGSVCSRGRVPAPRGTGCGRCR